MIGLLLAINYEVLPCKFGVDYEPVPQVVLQEMYDQEIAPYWSFQSHGLFQPTFTVREWKTAPTQTGWWQAMIDCVAAHNPPRATGYIIHSNQNIGIYSYGMAQVGLLIEGTTVQASAAVMLAAHVRAPDGISHEIGHMLALGHTNNSDNDYDAYDNPWDLMSNSWQYAVVYDRTRRQPKSLAAVHRKQLGWIEHSLALTSGTHEVQLVSVHDYGVQLVQVGPYSIERKKKQGYDAALPYEGVLVYNGVLLEDRSDFSSGPDSVLTFGETQTYSHMTVTVNNGFITVSIDPSLFHNGFEQ
jgi:hypothetical protein